MYKEFRAAAIAGAIICFSGDLSAQTVTKQPAKPAAAKPAAAAKAAPAKKPEVLLKTEMDSVAYAIGQSVGGSLKLKELDKVNADLIARGISDVLKGAEGPLSAEDANMVIGGYFKKQSDAKAEPNRIAGENFLTENKKRDGVHTTASGLQYEVIKAGEGVKPVASDQVKVHYHGTLIDGTVFDSSVERGEPIEFGVGDVIAGWQEALQLMPVGSKWKLFIPYQLAYGERAAGPTIGPRSALVFEVELLDIVKPKN